MTDLTLAARLTLDANKWSQGLGRASTGVKKFVAGAKHEFEALKVGLESVTGRLATLGVSLEAIEVVRESARIDKALTQIGIVAGASQQEVAGLRGELFSMATKTGQNVDNLKEGFDDLIHAGLSWKSSLNVLDATNNTMAVTGTSASTLASALGEAATAFNFDLDKPKQAELLLDKMTVASRLGHVPLTELSEVLSRIGTDAAGSGFGFDKTLAFIEGLSHIAPGSPRRVAALTDSTLQLFNNTDAMIKAHKYTGVRFLNADRSRRDPIAVLSDIKKKYDALSNDAQRLRFVNDAFGPTAKDIRSLLTGDVLERFTQISAQIDKAGGTTAAALPKALDNAVDQAGRLKNALGKAADAFARPFNKLLASGIEKLINPKDQGGMGLTGGQVIGGAATTLGIGYVLSRILPGIAGRLFKGATSTAAGVAEGKALEAAAGVTPVFVTNMPAGGIGGAAGDLVAGAAGGKVLKKLGGGLLARLGLGGLGGLLTADTAALAGAGAYGGAALAGGVGVAAVGGYKAGQVISDHALAGTAIGDKIGSGVARYLAFFGVKEAQDAVARMDRMEAAAKLKGDITVTINSQGQARVTSMSSGTPGVAMKANTGRLLAGGGR